VYEARNTGAAQHHRRLELAWVGLVMNQRGLADAGRSAQGEHGLTGDWVLTWRPSRPPSVGPILRV